MEKKYIQRAKRAMTEHQTHGQTRPELITIGMMFKLSGQLHELNNNIVALRDKPVAKVKKKLGSK